MALTDKLTAIADAIRSKTGSADALTLAQMPTEIEGIETGITPEGTLDITENGTHDVTQYAEANVNVPVPDAAPDGTDVTFGYENELPVEREEAYAISSESLNELGAVTQKMAGKKALMTVTDMIYWLNRVQYIPQGNAESSFALSLISWASGVLPDVQKGTATSAFSLSFTASAVGALQEG